MAVVDTQTAMPSVGRPSSCWGL